MLEAGGTDDWIWFHIPVGYLFAIGNPRADWMFVTGEEAGLDGRVSGLSARQGHRRFIGDQRHDLYARPTADYDRWRDVGLPGWGWDDVLPCFSDISMTTSARATRLPPAANGGSRRRGCAGISSMPSRRGRQAGIPRPEDFNTGDNEGVGYFHVNQKARRRWSAASAFLKPA